MANLKFTSTGPTTVTLSGNGLSNSFFANNSAYTIGTAISLADGETVEFYGTGTDFSKDANNFYQFSIGGTGTVTVEGDLISLINNNQYVKQYQFMKLFAGCDKITSIANLVFPATIADWCYANMFMDCTGLVDAGTTLPATAASRWCYQGMFARCSSMTTPPTILATKLAPFCYYGMFTGCTSLVEGPELNNAIVEGEFSNNIMFKDCTSLSTITVSFTNWPAGNWSRQWLSGVAQTGLFVKPNALTSIPEGYVPAGWTLSSTYPAKIIVASETFSFDAMSNTTQAKEMSYVYQGGTETLNINVDTTNMPSWLTYTTDSDSVNFSANGYAIDSSTSFEIPITFSAADAETKNVVATFNISNYPAYTITLNTIPTFTFDKESQTDIVCSLLDPQYVTYGGSSLSCEVEGELPTGLSCVNGVITGIPSQFTTNFSNNFTVVYSASDARTVISSVPIEIVNAADPDLVWDMDFTNGLVEPKSNITGTNTAPGLFTIEEDNTMGKYLQCRKSSKNSSNVVYWNESKTYLNNIFSDSASELITVSFWMRQSALYDPNIPFITKTGDGGAGLVWSQITGDKKLMVVGNKGGTSNSEVKYAPLSTTFNTWNHWVYVKDSNSARLYLNGTLVPGTFTSDSDKNEVNGCVGTNYSLASSYVNASEDLSIGGNRKSGWYAASYAMFDVTKYKIWHKALTAEQIQTLYTNKQ